MKKQKKRLSLSGLIVTLVVLWMLSRAFMMQPEINANKAMIENLQDKIEYEQIRAEEVEKLKEKVNTDEYIERVAREQLGLVMENEKIFIDVSSQ